MKVLSLFDGLSGGQIALERAGISHDGYYASEIDKHAIKVCQANYPDTIQLGDINGWQDWAIDWADIGLILAGSPCQGFSFAGKQLAFDDPRSKLFFTFVNILKFVQSFNPDVKFLLENVRMKKEYQQVITDMLGVEPVLINSALVSAQSRKRNYWFNWHVEQPEDKGILLKDILECGVVDRDKSYCIDACYKGGNLDQYFNKSRRQLVFEDGVKCGAIRGRYIVDGKRQDHKMKTAGKTTQRLEVRKDGKTNTLTTVQKDNVVVQVGMAADIKGHDFLKRIYSVEGKSPTLTAVCGGNQERKIAISDCQYRKLTPVECERLQTLPDNYTAHVSKTQRYKMVGNGWTVDVIAHILKQGGF